MSEQRYHVGRVERRLYWVTDGAYRSVFPTTSDDDARDGHTQRRRLP